MPSKSLPTGSATHLTTDHARESFLVETEGEFVFEYAETKCPPLDMEKMIQIWRK